MGHDPGSGDNTLGTSWQPDGCVLSNVYAILVDNSHTTEYKRKEGKELRKYLI